MDGPARDPGLQPERTRLAWRRTALTATGVSLLAARLALVDAAPLALLPAVALWLGVLVVSQHRVEAQAAARPPVVGRELPALALLITGYAVLGVVLVLW